MRRGGGGDPLVDHSNNILLQTDNNIIQSYDPGLDPSPFGEITTII